MLQQPFLRSAFLVYCSKDCLEVTFYGTKEVHNHIEWVQAHSRMEVCKSECALAFWRVRVLDHHDFRVFPRLARLLDSLSLDSNYTHRRPQFS
jgi:hypothetical protein